MRSTAILVLTFTLGLAATPGAAAVSSRVTTVSLAAGAPVAIGTFDGVAWERTWGTVTGTIDPAEAVVVFPSSPALPARYTVQFELFAPAAGESPSRVALVDVENRGGPALLGYLNDLFYPTQPPSTINYTDSGFGTAFPFRHGIAYARVQWQTDIASDPANPGAAQVPANAQGVGEVIVRDFGRLLARRSHSGMPAALPRFRRLILTGVSQSAWFVDTFVAEGFNANPQRAGGVYRGAITIDGAGNWLALNQLNGANPQAPYAVENSVPLTYAQILTRRASDPFFVDAAAYTDFYRLRASVSEPDSILRRVRRYDWPAAHASRAILPLGNSNFPETLVFTIGIPGTGKCNTWNVTHDGPEPTPSPLMPIPMLNPLDFRPYVRALVAGTARRLGVPGLRHVPRLPPSTLFTLGTGAIPAHPFFNGLPGVTLRVPQLDAAAQPVGGVRFPEVDLPIGVASPVAVPHVGTTAITDICGNFGGWVPRTKPDLDAQYGDESAYVALYAQKVDALVAAGFVLAEDKAGMLAAAAALYPDS